MPSLYETKPNRGAYKVVHETDGQGLRHGGGALVAGGVDPFLAVVGQHEVPGRVAWPPTNKTQACVCVTKKGVIGLNQNHARARVVNEFNFASKQAHKI